MRVQHAPTDVVVEVLDGFELEQEGGSDCSHQGEQQMSGRVAHLGRYLLGRDKVIV